MKRIISILVIALTVSFTSNAQETMKKDEMKKEAMMKKESMEKEAMMKKDNMEKEAMMKKDEMMKKDTMMKKATVVNLEQTKGAFTQKTLTLKEGDYVFKVSNKNVGHKVGFVLAPKSNPDAHIKTAYVTKAVENNTTESSNVTSLKKGEYVYFCPLNPTPKYTLIVK